MLGGSILAAPLAGEAQNTGKVWRIGLILSTVGACTMKGPLTG
jgi:hypothetical protein